MVLITNYIFRCVPPFVMIFSAACMLRGRQHREFPFLFNFLVFQIAAFAVEFWLRNWQNYFYLDWVITALGLLLSFTALVEIIQKIVGRTKTLLHWNIALLCWGALAAMAIIAMWPKA